jgi:hypothetical protein
MMAHPVLTVRNMGIKLRVLMSSQMSGPDDWPIILLAIVAGALVFLPRRDHPHAAAIGCATVAAVYAVVKLLWWQHKGQPLPDAISGLLLPNIQFPLFRFVAAAAFLHVLWRREAPVLIFTYLLLLTVNLMFIPQHRHRWMIDILLMLWTAIALRDWLSALATRIWPQVPADAVDGG